jgi:hypothetical protein
MSAPRLTPTPYRGVNCLGVYIRRGLCKPRPKPQEIYGGAYLENYSSQTQLAEGTASLVTAHGRLESQSSLPLRQEDRAPFVAPESRLDACCCPMLPCQLQFQIRVK